VSKPVGHKRNEAVGFAQYVENHLYEIDVRHLAVAAEIVAQVGARFRLVAELLKLGYEARRSGG